MSGSESSLRVLVGSATSEEPAPRETAYLVVDVLRACTTVAHALASDALGVVPVASVEDAMRLVATLDRETTVLCGERGALRIEGFDLGNSPAEMTREAVEGKTVVLSTTNGARALVGLDSARGCAAASLPTLSASVQFAAGFDHVAILCAGSEGRFSREDFFFAGWLAAEIERHRPGIHLDDAARTAVELAGPYRSDPREIIVKSDHGRRLAELGFQRDLTLACEIDRFSFVPVLRDGRLVAEGRKQASTR